LARDAAIKVKIVTKVRNFLAKTYYQKTIAPKILWFLLNSRSSIVEKMLSLRKFQLEDRQEYLIWLKQKAIASLPEIKNKIELLTVAIIVSLLFNWLHVPVSWLLGPMLVGIAYAIGQENIQPLPSSLAIAGQAIIALATAARFSWETLVLATNYAIPLIICIFITASLSLFNGYLLSRWAGIERMTGFLGCIPGAGSSIVALSEEIGADALAVALLQYLRILLVTSIVPTLASLFFSADSTPQTITTIPTESYLPVPVFLNLALLATCGSLGIWGGRRLNLPASIFLGPFWVGLITFWLLPAQLQVPQWVFTGGLLLVGLSIGLKFNWQTVRQLLKAVAIDVVLVLGLILMCLVVGYGFHLLTHVDLMTAILGNTPGGISAMIASAMELGGDSGLVMAMQIVRMMLILSSCPFLAALLAKNNTSEIDNE
jgi:membrane AbrB-like protein